MAREDGVRYVARPFVCGALGAADPALLARLRAVAPVPVTTEADEPGLRLFASAPPARWQAGDTRGWLWGAQVPGQDPTSWWGAARDAGAAGVALDSEGALLHTDQLGLQDVFVRVVGAAAYFSSRLDPLMRLTDTPVHPDWAAWATCLVVGAPIGTQTPVTEVRRIGCGAVWRSGAHGPPLEVRTRAFWDEAPDRAPDPAAMAALLEAALPPGRAPLVVPLSGGWDSRVLASLAVRQGRPVEAWTTYEHRPRERDVRLSVPVAEALGLDQRFVLPDLGARRGGPALVRRRTEHQTWLHAWLHPLARTLHTRGIPVLDGLYGDALLRANRALAAQRSAAGWPGGLFESSGARRLLTAAPDLAGSLGEASLGAFEATVRPFAGHPNAWTVGQLTTRQNRAIAMSPQWVLGPEVPVSVPFAHPAVVAGALAVPLAAKDEGAYYRELLRAACGPEGDLPSTNDPVPAAVKRADRVAPRPLLRELVDTVRASPPALRLLHPDVRVLVTGPHPQGPPRVRWVEALSWAALLADWEQQYADRLDWTGWPG